MRRVESRIVLDSLRRVDCARLLELGTGHGRLTPLLRAATDEFVGVDVEAATLQSSRATTGGSGGFWALANADQLPFRDSSFTAVVLVRVYHRLESPSRALAEVHRVLQPGGHLLVSVHPYPSLRTLYIDIGSRLRTGKQFPTLTFSRRPVVSVGWGRMPGHVETWGSTWSRLISAGFEIETSFVTGWEEIPVLRALPVAFLERLARFRTPPRFSPTLFVLARRTVPDRGASPAVSGWGE